MRISRLRRSKDPYAESFRERHALGIGRIRRWTKRVLFVAAVYGLYLLGVWLILPWGEVVSTQMGPTQQPEFSVSAANNLIPTLLLGLISPLMYVAFIIFIVVFQFVAIFWFLSRGRTYVIYPGEYDVSFDDVRGQKAAVEATSEVVRLFQVLQL